MKNNTLESIEKLSITNMHLQSFSTLSAVPQFAMARTSKFTFQVRVCDAYSRSGSRQFAEQIFPKSRIKYYTTLPLFISFYKPKQFTHFSERTMRMIQKENLLLKGRIINIYEENDRLYNTGKS